MMKQKPDIEDRIKKHGSKLGTFKTTKDKEDSYNVGQNNQPDSENPGY
jgi:hypothetical protein